ncbi:hypothetical protein CHUAL_005201 [Chamberlinius hualienensis]
MGSKFSSGRNRCAATYVFVMRHSHPPSSSCSNGDVTSIKRNARLDSKSPSLNMVESEEVLHQCMGEIEAFMHQLQMAVEFNQEWINPKYRKSKAKKPKSPKSHGQLHPGTMMPTEIDVININRRIKQAINCIAQLRFHLYEPNAPEMIRRLFVHLNVLYQLCHVCPLFSSNLLSKVLLPLLSWDAVQFLKLSLLSHEMDLWKSLGKAWTSPRNEWRGESQICNAVLLEGWEACYPSNGNKVITDQPWATKMTKLWTNGLEQRSTTEAETLFSDESNRSLSTPRSTLS